MNYKQHISQLYSLHLPVTFRCWWGACHGP